jgi:F-type H+-transporting ATPase subunit b
MIDLLLLAADEPAGAGHAEHADVLALGNWLPGLTALLVFGVAFIFLYWKVWPKIVQGLDDRENKIRQEIASAEEAREQARAALTEYEESLASARREAGEMIAKARADAKTAAEELRERNQRELSEMKVRAQTDIESAKHAAIAELHREATGLAAAIAGKILQREIAVEDQQRLMDETLTELGRLQEQEV